MTVKIGIVILVILSISIHYTLCDEFQHGGGDSSRRLCFINTIKISKRINTIPRGNICIPRGNVCIFADPRGVGKRKKQAKKKKGNDEGEGGGGEDGTQDSVAPRRITSENTKAGGLGLRKQLAYVKAYERMVSSPGVSYTKKPQYHRKAREEDPEEAKKIRKIEATDINAVVGRGSLPLVLVDGYNLLMKSPRYKKKLKKDPGASRDRVVGDFKELCAMKGWRGIVVWDGAGYKGDKERSDEVGVVTGGADGGKEKEEERAGGVKVVYSRIREEADEVIERMSRENKEMGVGKFIVVSDDGIIRDVSGGYGATIVSCQSVLNEIKSMRKGALGLAEVASERVSGESKYSKKGWLVEDNLDLSEIKEEIERRRRRRRREEEARAKSEESKGEKGGGG